MRRATQQRRRAGGDGPSASPPPLHTPNPTHALPRASATTSCAPRYAQHNCLASLEGLANAPGLVTLNVSGNSLASLAGLEACPQLATLAAERNHLEDPAALAPLAACLDLHTLDLQHNGIADAAALMELLPRLPALRCLYLKGNPAVATIPSYRKALICALPHLTYLDDRPVFPEERRCAEAWCVRGDQAARTWRGRAACVGMAARRPLRAQQALQHCKRLQGAAPSQPPCLMHGTCSLAQVAWWYGGGARGAPPRARRGGVAAPAQL